MFSVIFPYCGTELYRWTLYDELGIKFLGAKNIKSSTNICQFKKLHDLADIKKTYKLSTFSQNLLVKKRSADEKLGGRSVQVQKGAATKRRITQRFCHKTCMLLNVSVQNV